MRERRIPLGFEVGTGRPVEIPVRHLAVTGQTQESGKTTTLEALVARSGLRAIAFVTKRGESAFAQGRRITPYFRDRADWQFVDQLLEAQLREKNKFLRPWIIRICRSTRTLADVHRAVKQALTKAKAASLNEGVYTQLDAYLELIVPEIGRARLADGIHLEPGLNVMDVSGYATPMQMLFVRSAIEWVNERERGVVTIIPEAWEFIPEGKGSPVKAAAEALVRKGAGLGNYVWVDSQDMAGVDKVILRGCPVWLIGVQREANEIKRNLANIPAGIRHPKPAEIAHLGRGQFFACWAEETTKTYVQPAWLETDQARAVARGERRAEAVTPPAPPREEASAMCERCPQLETELTDTRRQRDRLAREASELGTVKGQLEAARREAREAREAAAAGEALGAALERFVSRGAAAQVSVEEIVGKVMARLPSGAGGAAIQLVPVEKLRKDFQQKEADRIVATVDGFKNLAKQTLRLLVAIDGTRLFQKTINERLGRATRGGSVADLGTVVKELSELGLVSVDPKAGVAARVREKIGEDLAVYQATPAEIEQTYQAVLHALATGKED
jgi:hypothetical protein